MAVLATTATVEDICAHLEDASTVMDGTEFEDMGRSFEEEGETFYVFALHPEHWKGDIEKAITDSGKKFKWL